MQIRQILIAVLLLSSVNISAQLTVEKWKIFELTLKGPKDGNPFADVKLAGEFICGIDTISVHGFYDGEGIYKIRFMPKNEGEWTYSTSSNNRVLNRKKGKFICTPAQKGNHGQVIVKNNFYFAYADETPHNSFGTTCYGWVHQGDSLAELTIKTLSEGYFNKMRMCIFPISYQWNNNEPEFYPFEGEPLIKWDFSRFNPAYFRNIEKRINQLDSLGIEADLIVFHPYDRWSFSNMDRETEDKYIKYIIARFAAYKNVWWSMANEFDYMEEKTLSDWDYYIEQFSKMDPYGHLLGIHNGRKWYDHTNPLITHASIQSGETYRANEYREKYKKPVVFDECKYEGNVPIPWGNLTAKTMIDKFWRGFISGGYVGHGETYVTESPVRFPNESSDILWWSKGGELRGDSPVRIKYLREIIETAPPYLQSISLFPSWYRYSTLGIENEYYLVYFNDTQPGSAIITLPENSDYKVEIIDTWNMTITPSEKKYSGHCLIELPGKPYIALRIVKWVSPGEN